MTLHPHSTRTRFGTAKTAINTTLQTVCQAPGRRARVSSHAQADCMFIQHVIASAHRVDIAKLRAPTRQCAPVAFARQIAMYLAHISRGLTLTEVGRCFERDRTTVAHACRLVEDNRDVPEIDLALDCLEAAITTRLTPRPSTDGW